MEELNGSNIFEKSKPFPRERKDNSRNEKKGDEKRVLFL